ncbi:hypothetical protein Zmor_018892 [Zophobas morio]|uniref:Peptidase S1 domain-containing protein n=1 Tax=Zophobas morio TaxID=2755281 RepID=A0AA38MDJ9_9CUCU|nr:hypothetical protein Zmor_018892 [Zophobas morio]
MKPPFLILVSVTLLHTTTASPTNGRIFGGTAAADGQFPFIASLNNPDHQFCAGVIINTNWVLTSAECIFEVTNTSTVLVGTNSQTSGGTTYNIAATVQHENFITITEGDDIGLIQIDGQFEMGDAVQVAEFGDPDGVNATCMAVGWGWLPDWNYSAELQFVEVAALSNADCVTISGVHLGSIKVGDGQVCSLGAEGEGVCFGDLGGPLVCGGKVAGVASYPIMACGMGFPDLYTRVSAYLDWINSHAV